MTHTAHDTVVTATLPVQFSPDGHIFCLIQEPSPSLLTLYFQKCRLTELAQSTEIPHGSRAPAHISGCWANNSPNNDSRCNTNEAGQGKTTGRKGELSFSFHSYHLLMRRRLQSRVIHFKRSPRIILIHQIPFFFVGESNRMQESLRQNTSSCGKLASGWSFILLLGT